MTTAAAPRTDRRIIAAIGPSGQVLAAVAFTVVAWASAFVAIRGVRDSFDPGALALGRLLIGTVALGAVQLAPCNAICRRPSCGSSAWITRRWSSRRSAAR